jgi:hypothetical protein
MAQADYVRFRHEKNVEVKLAMGFDDTEKEERLNTSPMKTAHCR